MSARTRKRALGRLRRNVPLFAALADDNRLSLLMRLGEESPVSITRLARGSAISRQAVTKHLRVLEDVGLVRGVRRGRECLYRIEPRPLKDAQEALDRISRQWDEALVRLKFLVEA